ncbi:hypothetical protein MRX96_046494, partial [Rhipicephalus microplus]
GKGNFTKLSLSFSENIDPDPVFHSLRYAAWSLQSLSIINTAEINTGGAMLLAVVIERSHLLRVLRLHGPISSKGSEQILASLAKSRSVALLTIENWDLKDNVATTFADMLRRNRSLCRLEFYWNDIADYLPFKDHFVRGLSTNLSVVVVKMYRGELRDEFPERDFNVLQYLHRNQMMLTWAVAVALRDGMRLEGRMIADCLQISETSLDFYQRTADISPRTADNRVRLARMATRTHYYELKTAFRVELRSWKKPQARIAAQNLVLSMRSTVMKTLRMEDAYLEDEMTEFGEEINTDGAMLLAVMIERSHLHRVLRLHGPISSKGSEQILASLAKSRSVALLTIENWDLKDNVANTFADMLRRNRSLCRLEFYWNAIADYLPFKDHFVRGLSTNLSVVVVKMYRGELRDEFPERDLNVLQYLHRNQMMLTWAVAVALRDGMRLEGRMIADCLQISETFLDFYQRTADFLPRTADNRVRLARIATRTHYYELKTTFWVELRSWKKPQARIAGQNLVLSMRSAVLNTLRMEDAYLEDEMTDFGEVPSDACQFQSD